MSPSSAHPEALPDIPALSRLTQSLAMLDAILCPEWLYRYYSFNSRWAEGAQMASMRDGCGSDWFLLFDGAGAALRGDSKTSPLPRNGDFAARIQTTVPAEFSFFLREPAFSMSEASFCLWRRPADIVWNVVAAEDRPVQPDEDGSAELLRMLDGQPATYREWAQDYYEREVTLEAVQAIYSHQPLAGELVAALNPGLSLDDVTGDATEIGYL